MIDVVNVQFNCIYIGIVLGGVWYFGSGGIKWEFVFEDVFLQFIGVLVINQANFDEIWVGIGEGNFWNFYNSGVGIFKFIDGGKNWKWMGLEYICIIYCIIIYCDNLEVVYVVVLGFVWGLNLEWGVFWIEDGGEIWEKVLFVNDFMGCVDLVVDFFNFNKLIVVMWEFGCKFWFFNFGGEGFGFYVFFDGGDSWEE